MNQTVYTIYEHSGPTCYSEEDCLKYWNDDDIWNLSPVLHSIHYDKAEAYEEFNTLSSYIDIYKGTSNYYCYSLNEELMDEDGNIYIYIWLCRYVRPYRR
jgi:hypothetical protein